MGKGCQKIQRSWELGRKVFVVSSLKIQDHYLWTEILHCKTHPGSHGQLMAFSHVLLPTPIPLVGSKAVPMLFSSVRGQDRNSSKESELGCVKKP